MKIKLKPFGLILIGIIIVFIGGFMKIEKMPSSVIILGIGLLVEIIGVIYFINWYRKARKNET